MRETLLSGLAAMGLELTDRQVDQLCRFGQLLLEKNQVMNLTAITEPSQVAQLHFLDCLAILKRLALSGKSLIDVGCGAGFPGVPLKIAVPDLRLTLLDSLSKRVSWLSETLPQLGLDAACVSARAEEYVQSCREGFDLAASRAVARLNVLCELCLPFVAPGGYFLAMKGPQVREELAEAGRAIGLLGGRVEEVYTYPVADKQHHVVLVKKTGPTPAQYPRRFSKIKQQPL